MLKSKEIPYSRSRKREIHLFGRGDALQLDLHPQQRHGKGDRDVLRQDRRMDHRSEKVRMIAAVAFIPYPYSGGESILRHIL